VTRSERCGRVSSFADVARLAVAATAPFGADLLERLVERHEVTALITRPDAQRGRGRRLAATPAKLAAQRLQIPVLQPARLRRGELVNHLRHVDATVVAAYGLLIPEDVLELGLWLNVHPSLLPRWRGAAPVERSIMAGDRETGVTIHETVKELDAGPIAAQRVFTVGPEDDAGAVFEHAAGLAASLLDDVLAEPRFEPQSGEGVTYAEKISAADRELDWERPAAELHDRVRALSPHIGARGTVDGRPVLIWRTRIVGGALELVEVQPEGKRRMTYEEFQRGLR
jgi:methionyl-tRNA formyltransferase